MEKSTAGSPHYLTDRELASFRTQPCVHRALKRACPHNDDCFNSHCLSWCRRNPYDIYYKARLCPFVVFRREDTQTRVKNFCNRRRFCPYAHTKEEQMYHPAVYKTKLCRVHPRCSRIYCPFAHGVQEMRRPGEEFASPYIDQYACHGTTLQQSTCNLAYPLLSNSSTYSQSHYTADNPLMQSPFPSSLPSPESHRSGVSHFTYRQAMPECYTGRLSRSFSQDTVQDIEPLGNLVLAPDGYFYVRVGMMR